MREIPTFTCQHCQLTDADVVSMTVSYKKGDAIHGKRHPACFKQIEPTLKRKGDRMIGICRNPPPSDPRSLDHPAADEAWGEFAASVGRSLADKVYEARTAT